MPVDYKQLQQFNDKLHKELSDTEIDKFMESCAKEISARLMQRVIPRTPVGDYSGEDYTCVMGQPHKGNKKNRVGGTLRRGWTVGDITKRGNVWQVDVINPVEYAPYVEYGHRTRNHAGWVEGHFMLTISEDEIQNDAPRILENKLKKKLEGVFK